MDNVENLILEHLRAIRTDIGSIKDDVRELKLRVGNLEVGQATMMQHLGHHAAVGALRPTRRTWSNTSYDQAPTQSPGAAGCWPSNH